jgi:hypothetical protein
VQIQRAFDLKRHDLRDITTSGATLLVLTEDGLSTLGADGQVIDFVRGGGQQIAVSGGRVYVAARDMGARILQIDPAGHLTLLGAVPTLGPALQVAADTPNQVWVAEGNSGVRLYDTTNPRAVVLRQWIGDRIPAAIVRLYNNRLFIGHGGSLSIFDTGAPPRLLSTTSIDSPNQDSHASVADLLVLDSRVFVGRTDPQSTGADLVVLDIAAQGESHVLARIGTQGAGEHLALRGDDLFIGSARGGLARIYVGHGDPVPVASWGITASAATACSVSAPLAPQPPDLSTVFASPVVLSWHSGCAAAHELRINGKPVTAQGVIENAGIDPVTGADVYRYAFTPPPGAFVTWQVTAIDAAGNRAESPLWRFEAVTPGWLVTPAPLTRANLLYRPPLIDLDANSPAELLVTTCGALCAGLLVISGAAYWLGLQVQRRSAAHSDRL